MVSKGCETLDLFVAHSVSTSVGALLPQRPGPPAHVRPAYSSLVQGGAQCENSAETPRVQRGQRAGDVGRFNRTGGERKREIRKGRSPANVDHHPGDDNGDAETHLDEEEDLLNGRQAAEVDDGKAADGHRADTVVEAVNVVDVELAPGGIEDAREDGGRECAGKKKRMSVWVRERRDEDVRLFVRCRPSSPSALHLSEQPKSSFGWS